MVEELKQSGKPLEGPDKENILNITWQILESKKTFLNKKFVEKDQTPNESEKKADEYFDLMFYSPEMNKKINAGDLKKEEISQIIISDSGNMLIFEVGSSGKFRIRKKIKEKGNIIDLMKKFIAETNGTDSSPTIEEKQNSYWGRIKKAVGW